MTTRQVTMENAAVEVEYLSIGGNRQTAAADWHRGGTLAFGADVNIALWRTAGQKPRGITGLLAGHKSSVKAVKFLPEQDDEESTSYLVSGADDQSLKLWAVDLDIGSASCLETLEEHSGAINCIAAVHESKSRRLSRTIVASGAADASIKIWTRDLDHLHLHQSIKTSPKFFPLSLALSPFGGNGDAIVLAAGGTRETIQIFVADLRAPNLEFKLQATLTGHEGWIRSLDFSQERADFGSDVILASASQDKYVRLWRLHQGMELPVATAGSDPSMGAFMPGKSPSNKAHRIEIGSEAFTITFEALLLGHEDWIYSAKWHYDEGAKLQLLSASADNSLAIWEADPSSGIWITSARLGEVSKEKGATTATGSTGGFWTGLWSPDGSCVVCLGRTGSWRRWEYDKEMRQWVQQLAVTGHTRAVTGISWSKNGEYMLSTSSDQTTRLHAEWKCSEGRTWHEMSRPQIHGYDLNCVDSLGTSQFVSGADEKLMRVFNEPKAVARLLNRLAGAKEDTSQIEALPEAANMPVLGLSNKAVIAVEDDEDIQSLMENDPDAVDPSHIVRKSVLEIDHPPFEDSLSRHTLWPETEKLYGHGYEISCLAVSHDGRLIASACRASSVNHAVIRLFETERWTEVKPPLTAHSLTATRLRFSADDRYLLSVGRDRQWAVFEKDRDASFRMLQTNPKGHARMILDAAWAPWDEPRVFATAGRDKQVKVWWRRGDSDAKFELAKSISDSHPVTALDFLPTLSQNGEAVLAVGSEAGSIQILSVKQGDGVEVVSTLILKLEFHLPKAVLQLAWQPKRYKEESNKLSLAVAGEDSSLRIYKFMGL